MNDVINNFVNKYDLKPGYVIIAKARQGQGNQYFDHPLIYLGQRYFPTDDGGLAFQHIFAINMSPQAQFIGENKVLELLNKYYPAEVQRCYRNQPCNPNETAQRAFEIIQQLEPEKYNLLWNNCQDFVNRATTGKKASYQRDEIIENVGKGLLIGAGAFILSAFITTGIKYLSKKL